MSYEEEQQRLQTLWDEFGAISDVESEPDNESDGEGRIPVFDIANNAIQMQEEEKDDEVEIANLEPTNNEEDFFLDANNVRWSQKTYAKNVRTRSENIITHLPGVKQIAKNIRTVLGSWSLFITEEMLHHITEYTNVKLLSVSQSYDAAHQYLVKPTDAAELKAVLGLLYLAGLYKGNRQNLGDFWCTDGSGVELFRTTMSKQRFYILLQSMRFDNIQNRAQRREIDKIAAIRAIYDRFIENCRNCYTPSEYLTIDEKLESFRGHVSFRQYIPNKPSKYGLKVFALVDAKSYYCLNMELYVGMQPEGPYRQSNSPFDVVKRLVDPVKGSKRNITFDNWFTSYPLMIELLDDYHLTSVGTVRKNKKHIPRKLLTTKKRAVYSSLFAFQPKITAVSYTPKKNKNVILFSTLHHTDEYIPESEDKQLPEIIDFYNMTKGRVDTLDELSANYTVARNSRRWTMTLFYSLLNTAGVNAQVIFKSNTKEYGMKRSLFLKQLGMSLIEEHRKIRQSNPRICRSLRQHELKIPEEPHAKRQKTSSRCLKCPRAKDRKTFHICKMCHFPICLDHANFYCENCSKFE